MKEHLAQRMLQVLTDLEFLSEAQAAKGADSSPKLSAQHPGGNPPPGESRGECDYHYLQFLRAVERAEQARDSLRKRIVQEGETRDQFRYRVLTDYEGAPVQLVADKESVSAELVRKIRGEAGRNYDNGREPQKRGPKPRGGSVRPIA